VSRNKFVQYERSEIIGRTSIDKRDAEKARKWNRRIDDELERRRKEWAFIPPSNMSITLFEDAGAIPGGLVLSVPHEVGRVMLHRRLGRIFESAVTIDAVIDGGIEDACEAMNSGEVAS
jgi:hypothetical protein